MKQLEKLTYFPGCTLKDTARDFEISGMAVMEALGYVLEELERWNCCGTVFSLTDDDLMHQIAPVRDLLRAQEAGSEEIIALCSMCYATLKRTSLFVNGNEERLDKINSFMNNEVDYEGKVSVHHLLEVIRDRIGWEKIEERVTNPLEGLSVAPFYGCTLLRPEEIAIDDPDAPTVLQDLSAALWATPIDYAYSVECCGAYQVVDHRDVVVERTHRIISAARRAGADVIVTSCPLCHFNLHDTQKELVRTIPDYEEMPIIYFTQLMALAYGVEAGKIPASLKAKIKRLQAVKGEG